METKTPSSFKIYDASAGSGKTFTLVKAYLGLLLASNSDFTYQNILAITFTNKAVGEMKKRIIDTLKKFSNNVILNSEDVMFLSLCKELELPKEQIQNRSKRILNTILHNYASFNISTIDGFNHNLIRTFAHDLKLPVNFQVELDTKLLLQKAVDEVISKAGINQSLTKTLIEFALEKTDDDKSWDISKDLYAVADLLTKENHLEHLKSLKETTLEDFSAFKKETFTKIKAYKTTIENEAKTVLSLFKSKGLTVTDFTRGTVFNHFVNALELKQGSAYSVKSKLEENLIERKNIYKVTTAQDKKDVIEQILPKLYASFLTIKTNYFQYKFHKAIYKNITPLSLLNEINLALNLIKSEDNKMLISEFNTIISNEIKHQPTPYIYERIGEKFKHYFIDEFQDTSELQWENIKPLMENTLSGENLNQEKGTAMIVGDAKQAIYRWRGGRAEQFLGLINEEEPFTTPKEVIRLESNYRSHEAIINFNNNLFQFLASQSVNFKTYSDLYQNAAQKIISKQKGSVSVSFLEYKNKEESNTLYPLAILDCIKQSLSLNYKLQDICILVRKKDQAKTIASFLGENGVRFTSSDSLLLTNADEVNFINELLCFIIKPDDRKNLLKALHFLAEKWNITDKHDFFASFIHLDVEAFFSALVEFGIHFNIKKELQLPLFDLAESIVRHFKLVDKSNAYIQFYLESILDFTQKKSSSILEYLEWFELNKKSLKVSTSEDADAVKIMTIHSSKGLEFPIVIYPYVEMDVYKDIKPQEWVNMPQNEVNISESLLDYSKDFENYNGETARIYSEHRAKQELDQFNVFYVALTRPVEKLFILTKKKKPTKSDTFEGVLALYLESIGENITTQDEFVFGDINQVNKEVAKSKTEEELNFASSPKEDHQINIVTKSGQLWDSTQEEAIEKGNIVHLILSKINVPEDIDSALKYFVLKNEITLEQVTELKPNLINVVNHPELKHYFSKDVKGYNETDILIKGKSILRPDRFVVENDNVTILDYKSGLKNPKYKEQLYDYKDALEELNYKVIKMLLIYINETITIEEV
ncbi:UvrD-helicase domain-containing protein [Aurantibacter sp.]|uniref:UvrD-helicase domain-containing protein n=1 Tax=Aurantibacter sp. TaxID=2807103 RepID=UPI0035C7DACA